MGTTSSYLIDTSKKCVIPKAGKDENGVYWTAYGDVESKSLQNFKYTYVEDFAHAYKLLEDDFESLAAPLTQVIKAVTSKVPILKNVHMDNTDDLKDSALFLYSIYDAFVNTDASGNSTGADSVSKLAENFEKPYLYSVPMRKAAPAITFNPGDSITINFAYGKCNLFNAYEEVYRPLQEIHKALFPKVKSDPEHKGLGKVDYTYSIPYEQQSFVEMVKTVLGDAARGIQKLAISSVDANKGMLENLPELQATANKISTSEDLVENIKLSSESTKYNNSANYKKIMKEAIADAYQDDEEELEEDINSVYSEESKDRKLGELAKEALSTAIAEGQSKASSLKKNLDIPKSTFELKNNKKGWKLSLKDVTAEEAKKNQSLKDTLVDLVNIKPIAVGSTLERLANQKLEGVTNQIRLGFPPMYVTSLQDLGNVIDESKETYINPKITLKYLLFTKVTIGFDFSNTDEAGWPMAGTLKIEDLWTLRYPDQTVEFSEDKTQDKLYTKKPITYNPDTD